MNKGFYSMYSKLYKNYLKNILFHIDAERVHNLVTIIGEIIGKLVFTKNVMYLLFFVKNSMLKQTIAGINFENPVGLAAGFDYNGKLTQILPSVGFGYETIGTITNNPYDGNPKPRLGRLPKSKSLMVNKGFKNLGADIITKNLKDLDFKIPIGISIGITNSASLKTQKEGIEDIINAFKKFEKAKIKNSYYELNISCPNLMVELDFYSPKNLNDLLTSIEKLKIKKPIFIKMPISKTNTEILDMLKIIANHKITGVIFGNLLKDRSDKSLKKFEVKKFSKGYFSGKPTEKRSNELIALAYKKYKNKLIIIGCGGIFNAEDAYKKIKLGASLVQLITGLIYEGPFLPYKINKDFISLLEKDGYKNISEAIGKNN